MCIPHSSTTFCFGATGRFPCAFDPLSIEGEVCDRDRLTEDKRPLKRAMPCVASPSLYVAHSVGRGRTAFAAACERHVEGHPREIAPGPYETDGAPTGGLMSGIPVSQADRAAASVRAETGRQVRHRDWHRPVLALSLWDQWPDGRSNNVSSQSPDITSWRRMHSCPPAVRTLK